MPIVLVFRIPNRRLLDLSNECLMKILSQLILILSFSWYYSPVLPPPTKCMLFKEVLNSALPTHFWGSPTFIFIFSELRYLQFIPHHVDFNFKSLLSFVLFSYAVSLTPWGVRPYLAHLFYIFIKLIAVFSLSP